MNVENLALLAAHLRKPAIGASFDLNWWLAHNRAGDDPIGVVSGELINECGSVACIAGHAAILADPTFVVKESAYELREKARIWLDLTDEEASMLFTPDSDVVNFDVVTATVAADVLDGLIKHGVIEYPDHVIWP